MNFVPILMLRKIDISAMDCATAFGHLLKKRSLRTLRPFAQRLSDQLERLSPLGLVGCCIERYVDLRRAVTLQNFSQRFPEDVFPEFRSAA